MEDLILGKYLSRPEKVKSALDLLDNECGKLSFEELYKKFEDALGIESGEGFPITVVTIGGLVCRARINDKEFPIAETVNQIGVKKEGITQGRANAAGYPVFYGANRKQTAAFEVLQDKEPGAYIVTIGCWKSENGLNIANLVDGEDPDLKKIPFVHSFPKRYLDTWPDLSKKSAFMIVEYFREKFKMPFSPRLYNITNVIAAVCFSLGGVDGIGYGAVSDKYEGFNVALRNPSKVTCDSVERWFIEKGDTENWNYHKLQAGHIDNNGRIFW